MTDRSKPARTRDPYKTTLVVKHNGKEIGRIPAAAANREQQLVSLKKLYGSLEIEEIDDPDAGMLAALWGSR